MQDYDARFSPAYAQQYLFPYRQVDPNITYPGPSITHTVGQLGDQMLSGGGWLMAGIGVAAGLLLAYGASKLMPRKARRRRRR